MAAISQTEFSDARSQIYIHILTKTISKSVQFIETLVKSMDWQWTCYKPTMTQTGEAYAWVTSLQYGNLIGTFLFNYHLSYSNHKRYWLQWSTLLDVLNCGSGRNMAWFWGVLILIMFYAKSCSVESPLEYGKSTVMSFEIMTRMEPKWEWGACVFRN